MKRVALLRDVGEQQLEHHLLRMQRARAVARHFHPGRGRRQHDGGEHALAFHFDHARAAVAVGPHAFRVTEVRDLDAVLARRLDDRLVRLRLTTSVPFKLELAPASLRFRRSLIAAPYCTAVHFTGKYFMHRSIGFGAACPSPQSMRPSSLATALSTGARPRGAAMSAERLCGTDAARRALPHTPPRRTDQVRAALAALSLSESIITAAEPIRHPWAAAYRNRAARSPSDAAGCRPKPAREDSRGTRGREHAAAVFVDQLSRRVPRRRDARPGFLTRPDTRSSANPSRARSLANHSGAL